MNGCSITRPFVIFLRRYENVFPHESGTLPGLAQRKIGNRVCAAFILKRKIMKAITTIYAARKYSLYLVLLMAHHVVAQTSISSAQNGAWSQSSTWIGGIVPGTGSDVFILPGDTITLDVNADPGTVTILANGMILQNTNGIALGNATPVTDVVLGGTLKVGPNCSSFPALQSENLVVSASGIFDNEAANAACVSIQHFVVDNHGIYFHDAGGSTADGATSDFPGSNSILLNDSSEVYILQWATNSATNIAPLPEVNWGNLEINVGNVYGGGAYWNMGHGLDTVLGDLTLVHIGLPSVTLGGNSIIGGKLTLTQGIVTTGAYELYLSNPEGSALVGGSDDAFINGNLERACATSGNYDFPVGLGANLEDAQLNITSQTGMSRLQVHFYAPVDGADPDPNTCQINGSPIYEVMDGGIWSFTPDVSPGAAIMQVTLKETGQSNAPLEADHAGIIHRTDNTTGWVFSGTHTNGTQSNSGGVFTAVVSNLATLEQMSIGIGVNPLPVTLLHFQGKTITPGNLLTWSTASEQDSYFFGVERSDDGRTFHSIGVVKAAGNSETELNYQLVDPSPQKGTNYYRLRLQDQSGSSSFSEVILLQNENANGITSVYPNPARDLIYINPGVYQDQLLTIEIKDALGRTVIQDNAQGGGSNLALSVAALDDGQYFVSLIDKTGRPLWTQPLLKQ